MVATVSKRVVKVAALLATDQVPEEIEGYPVERCVSKFVPPYVVATFVPCHTPVPMVATEVRAERVVRLELEVAAKVMARPELVTSPVKVGI